MSNQPTFDVGHRGEGKVSPQLQCILSLIGFTSVIAQIVLMRELIVVFYGNEISLGIMLASWLLWTALGSSLSVRFRARVGFAEAHGRTRNPARRGIPADYLRGTRQRPCFIRSRGNPGPGSDVPHFLRHAQRLLLLSGGLFAAGSRLCGDETRTSRATAASSVYLWRLRVRAWEAYWRASF